jgi:transcription antitermination factor NusG
MYKSSELHPDPASETVQDVLLQPVFRSKVSWYAVWTRSRQEKAAAARLRSIGIVHYLPLQSTVRHWSDRRQIIEVPLFPGYLFVQLDVRSGSKLEVLKSPGVVGFIGNSSGAAPIPEVQIDSIRKILIAGMECSAQALFKEGERVRVVRGALAGIEGSLLRVGSKSQLIIAVEMIQRSVAVTVCEQDVEPAGCQDASTRPGRLEFVDENTATCAWGEG